MFVADPQNSHVDSRLNLPRRIALPRSWCAFNFSGFSSHHFLKYSAMCFLFLARHFLPYSKTLSGFLPAHLFPVAATLSGCLFRYRLDRSAVSSMWASRYFLCFSDSSFLCSAQYRRLCSFIFSGLAALYALALSASLVTCFWLPQQFRILVDVANDLNNLLA